MDATFVQDLFSSIAKKYDFTNHLLSGGLDYFWRAKAAKIVQSWKGKYILDLATGSGDLALALRRALPQAEIVGVDFCQDMLLEAKKKGLSALVNGDGTRLPFYSGIFDVITIAFGLRNMTAWAQAVQEMARVLAPHGKLLVLDSSLPDLAWVRNIYRIYLHYLLPKIAHWTTGNRNAYQYLGKSIEEFPSGQSMLVLLEANGFQDAHVHPLCLGIVSLYTAQRSSRTL